MSLRGSAEAYGPAYVALLALSAACALGAAITLLPSARAPWPNVLGYKSVCPFAPAATFGCALFAAAACSIRARRVKRAPPPAFVAIAVYALLVAGLAWSATAWAREKARYADATSAATAESR